MKSLHSLLGLAALPLMLHAQDPAVHQPRLIPSTMISPGVTLKELSGRAAMGDMHSDRVSVALFHLEPGRASAWSHNRRGEESFFVVRGTGAVWTGTRWQRVHAGSYVLIPPSHVRSIRAGGGGPLDFYAITAPAWTQDDDVHVDAPDGAE